MIRTNLGLLRIIGLLEGFISLLLISFAFPLWLFKGTVDPAYSTFITYSALGFVYVCLVFIVSMQLQWNRKKQVLAILALTLPLGTFLAEKRLFRNA